jgi:hypothetical protein
MSVAFVDGCVHGELPFTAAWSFARDSDGDFYFRIFLAILISALYSKMGGLEDGAARSEATLAQLQTRAANAFEEYHKRLSGCASHVENQLRQSQEK